MRRLRIKAIPEYAATRGGKQDSVAPEPVPDDALGTSSYAALQLMQIVGERGVRIVPDVSATGGGAGSGLIDALLGSTLRDRIAVAPPAA